jgi:ABC-type branched-subunit amino acid transport system ATPase component/ABC-type branched-subunit amino acid transport system permease subunit
MPAWLDDLLWTYQNVIYALGINGLLALAMYVVLAVGQLSLGQAAFMGLGAYSGALLSLHTKLPFLLVLPLSCAAPAAFALAIGLPTVRLSGVYLAIATIGLGEVLRAIYLNVDALGGALGLSGIPERAETWEIYALLALAVLGFLVIQRSRIGRAMEALREDETAARTMGVPARRYKLMALLASSVLAGLAGCLNAHVASFIGPNEYGFEPAVTILSYALLGGIASPLGPVLGAWVLTLLPEVLRDVADVRMVVNGAIIVLVVLFLPGGLLPRRARKVRGVQGTTVPSRAAACRTSWGARGQSPLVLRLDRLGRRFAGVLAVDSVDMSVQAGTIHAVIGPNGAGKTTLFNLIAGLVVPSAGRILLDGIDISRLSPEQRARQGIARTFQNLRVFPGMTVLENVLCGLHVRLSASLPAILSRRPSVRAEEAACVARARAMLDLVGLAAAADRLAGTLAYGDQRRLEIARALAAQPRLLLLDEPAAGMNPTETASLADLVARIRDLGITVLLVEHDMGFVMGLCDRVTVLNFGRCIFDGAPAQARAAPDVVEAYLGRQDGPPPRPRSAARAAGPPLLACQGLSLGYGRTPVVHGLDLAVGAGRVVCLLGANGAGKTTTLRALSGLLRPAAGRIVFDGADITALPAPRIAALGLRHVPEGRQVFAGLSVADNLALGAWTGADRAETARRRAQVLDRFPRLRERLRQPAGTLSGGEQQMLAIGRALMGAPRLLLLDEPSMGLAPLFVAEIFAIIADLKAAGVTILLVEQNAAAALAVADDAYVLESGRLALHGPAAEVASNPAVAAAYFGG